MEFEFPDLFPKDVVKKSEDDGKKSLEESKKGFRKYLDRNKARPGTPGWFSI